MGATESVGRQRDRATLDERSKRFQLLYVEHERLLKLFSHENNCFSHLTHINWARLIATTALKVIECDTAAARQLCWAEHTSASTFICARPLMLEPDWEIQACLALRPHSNGYRSAVFTRNFSSWVGLAT